MSVLHRLQHWIHWQPVIVVTEWRDHDLWIGAMCATCKEISGWHKGNITR